MKAYLSDFDLDGSVVLGANESVGGGALSGDVEFYNSFLFVLHICCLKSKTGCFKIIINAIAPI